MDKFVQFCFLYLTTEELLHSEATLLFCMEWMDRWSLFYSAWNGQVVTILACLLIFNVKYLITLTSIL